MLVRDDVGPLTCLAFFGIDWRLILEGTRRPGVVAGTWGKERGAFEGRWDVLAGRIGVVANLVGEFTGSRGRGSCETKMIWERGSVRRTSWHKDLEGGN